MSEAVQSPGGSLGTLRNLSSQRYLLAGVCLVATLAALLHMAPYWRAQHQTPPGWTFTGNLSGSPDAMQYRVWPRQSLETGLFVTNKFIPEETEPHILVLFYYVIGRISYWSGASPEAVYSHAGAVIAFLLTILLFLVVHHFMKVPHRTWWVFLAILIGGGMGSHLVLLNRFIGPLRETYLFQRTLVQGIWNSLFFENYRGNYVFVSLFDTHFMLLWLITTSAVCSLYLALRRTSFPSIMLMMASYALVTLVHIYEGVTLLVITLAVVYLSWHKGLARRSGIAALAAGALSVGGSIAWQLSLFRSSGLSLPHWRAWDVLFSMVLLAYPLAWVLIAWGIAKYWRRGGLDESFLLGWALACTALLLSGPFYPYPDRGAMTLQIPLFIIAGSIYFQRFGRVSLRAALVVILILGVSPVRTVVHQWRNTAFNPEERALFLSAEHLDFIDLLNERAGKDDVLMVDKSREDWRTDDLWLGPEYPGRLFPGHFFLSSDYERKRAEVNRFFAPTLEEHIEYLERRAEQLVHAPPSDSREIQLYMIAPEGKAAYLDEVGVRFLFVPQKRDPDRFLDVPGLSLLKSGEIGALFEFSSR